MYTYQQLIKDCKKFKLQDLVVDSIGISEDGRDIPYVHLGDKRGKQIIIQGAIHAREWPTALLVVKQIIALSKIPFDNLGGIYFIPMTNPDGNTILDSGNMLYKANINGVDLNTNFDAAWGHGLQNVRVSGTSDFIGNYPFCQNETRALRNFTLKIRPVMTISYHAKGKEIYYLFNQTKEIKRRDRKIAAFVADWLEYKLVETVGGPGYPIVSAGGYKDWCISSLGIPSLTIEIISDDFEHPLTAEMLTADEIKAHINLPIKLLEIL